MLLHHRERVALARLVEDFPVSYTRLLYEHKLEIVGEIATSMILQGLSTLPRSVVRQIIEGVLEQLDERWVRDAGDLLEVLVLRSGVLRLSGRDEVAFVHDTLKEYLAAPRLVSRGFLPLLIEKADDPAWQSVVVFACAIGGREATDDLIGRLLPSEQAVIDRGRQLLAIRCAEAALGAGGLAPALQRKVQKARKSLFPPQKMKEAEALAALGDSAVPYLRPTKTLRANEAAASVRALCLVGTDVAHDAIREFAADGRLTVLNELLECSFALKLSSTSLQKLDLRERNLHDLAPLQGLARLQLLELMNTQVRDHPVLHALSARGVFVYVIADNWAGPWPSTFWGQLALP